MIFSTDSLAASDLPFLQVACKCDVNPEPLEDNKVDAIHDRYEIYRTSFSSPRSQRMCIALVLRAVISTREGEFGCVCLFFGVRFLGQKHCGELVCLGPL
jgi:hypothetical protein